jgi:hypothetical protein
MTAVYLPNKLVEEAKRYSSIYRRSVPKQIEHWFHIGMIAEENPDLHYSFIKDILLSLDDVREGRLETYKFNDE